MVLPLADSRYEGTTAKPVVNILLIAANIFVFVFLQHLGSDMDFTYAFSTVPAEIITGKDIVTKDEKVYDKSSGEYYLSPGLRRTPFSVYITLITSMFMHGGIAHILGNMLFLFIFGDNLEGRLGHLRYFLFYMICGIIASLSHVASTYMFGLNPYIPSLGASGAISGVLGGYIVLFPRNRVTVLMFNFVQQVPAFLAIGLWFVFQLISGLGMLGGYSGGVAYGA